MTVAEIIRVLQDLPQDARLHYSMMDRGASHLTFEIPDSELDHVDSLAGPGITVQTEGRRVFRVSFAPQGTDA